MELLGAKVASTVRPPERSRPPNRNVGNGSYKLRDLDGGLAGSGRPEFNNTVLFSLETLGSAGLVLGSKDKARRMGQKQQVATSRDITL